VFVDVGAAAFVLKTPTSSGVASEVVVFPTSPALVGLSLFTQSLAFDPVGPLGVLFSNGLRITFCTCP
jgi:hypothetical protein